MSQMPQKVQITHSFMHSLTKTK